MPEERDIDLINELLSQDSEKDWLEFKENNTDPEMIGTRCSALSNSARLAGKDFAYIVWGIEDSTHNVTGTSFSPDSEHVKKQPLPFWIAQNLQPSIAFTFREVDHPGGKVVLMEIPAATSAPVTFKNIPYIRIGSATPKLTEHPERYQQLVETLRPYAWEHSIARQYIKEEHVLQLIDYENYFRLTQHSIPEDRHQIFERLQAERIIKEDVGGRWNITNLGAILFARDLEEFDSSLARKGVRFVSYSGKNRASTVTHRIDGRKGYACGFEGLIEYINAILPKNEHIGSALREERPLFPEIAIRETVANALIHQDMTITGSGPQIELFSDRMEITNPGGTLIQPMRMIDLPPRSRNEALASLMRRMGMCEEQGSGLDKAINAVEFFQLPPPLFREGKNFMQVVLYGPRKFSEMTPEERVRACYQHAVLKFLSGERMKNASLCYRFGIASKNASQASVVIRHTQEEGLIKIADPDHPRAGYVPFWA